MSLKSFFKKVEKGLRPLGGVVKTAVGSLPGGGAVLAARDAVRRVRPVTKALTPLLKTPAARQVAAAPQTSLAMSLMGVSSPTSYFPFPPPSTSMSLLPALVRGGAAVVRRRAGAVATGAATAATVGSVMYDAAGNPVRKKRRRGKGITATELKSFTRVTGLLNKFCKTPPPRRSAPRGKSKCR